MEMTYEKLRKAINKAGYSFRTNSVIPEGWGELKERQLVMITPEMAKSLLDHTKAILKTMGQGNKLLETLQYGFWNPTIGEVDLLDNYKICNGSNIIEDIVKAEHAINVYVNVRKPNKLGFGTENDVICDEIINAVDEILQNHQKELPDIEASIWHEELPKKLAPKLNIEVSKYMQQYADATANPKQQVLVGIMDSDRNSEFPDMLYIVDGTTTGAAAGYPCNMFPAVGEELNPLILKPGIYIGLFVPDANTYPSNISLIQANDANISKAVLRDKQIVSYEDTSFRFMRIGIPVQEPDNGIIKMGVAFSDTNTENLFISNFDFDHAEDVTYIVLDKDSM